MDSKEAAKARVRAKVAAEKAMPASERIANTLHATHTHADAQALLDELRAEARSEALREAADKQEAVAESEPLRGHLYRARRLVAGDLRRMANESA